MLLYELFQKINNPAEKTAILLSELDYKAIKSVEKNAPKLIKEVIYQHPQMICIGQGNFALRLIQKYTPYIFESGIYDHLYSFLMDFELKPLLEDPAQPYVFNLDDLWFVFVVWTIALGVSTVVFIIEVIWIYWRKWVGFVFFMRILKRILKLRF